MGKTKSKQHKLGPMEKDSPKPANSIVSDKQNALDKSQNPSPTATLDSSDMTPSPLTTTPKPKSKKQKLDIQQQVELGPIRKTSLTATRLTKKTTDSLISEIKTEHTQALLKDKKALKSKKMPLSISVKVGKKNIELTFNSKKQLDAFIKSVGKNKLLNKNKKQIQVKNNDNNEVLYPPNADQQKQQQKGSKQQPWLDPIQIFDGSEIQKTLMAEKLVADFDKINDYAAEHTLDIALEPDELEKKSEPKEEITHDKTQEKVLDKALEQWDSLAEKHNKSNTPEPSPESKPKPKDDLNMGG